MPCPLTLALERALASWPPGALLVALSGGGDSSVLLHALARSPAARARGLRAMHVDHGLHTDSTRWAQACERLARALEVPIAITRVTVLPHAGGLEAAARDARYAALGNALQAGEILVVAHHADDQAETVLLRLMRGAGAAGLAAMRPLRPFADGWLARPLLELPRHALRAYAQAHGLDAIEDPSNARSDRDRNFLRHEVLPLLRSRWPGADAALARSAGLAAASFDSVQREALRELALARGPDPHTLRLDALRGLTPFVRGAVLQAWLVSLGHVAPGAHALAQVEATLLDARDDAEPCVQLDGMSLRRHRALLHAVPDREPLPARWHASWDTAAPLTLPASCGTLALSPTVDLRLEARFRRGGERIRLAPSRPSQSLKHALQELGIPAWERERIPLLWHGDDLWAAGDMLLADAFAQTLRMAGARLHWTR